MKRLKTKRERERKEISKVYNPVRNEDTGRDKRENESQ